MIDVLSFSKSYVISVSSFNQQLQIQMPLTMKMTLENLDSGKVELAYQGVYAQFIDH